MSSIVAVMVTSKMLIAICLLAISAKGRVVQCFAISPAHILRAPTSSVIQTDAEPHTFGSCIYMQSSLFYHGEILCCT